jgi:uncharacterized DUF497 family protein
MLTFVWDDRKRLANLDKHGFDFADVYEFDWAGAVTAPARTDRFGRPRLKAIGRFRGGTTVVIYSRLGAQALSIISFRQANIRERMILDEQR